MADRNNRAKRVEKLKYKLNPFVSIDKRWQRVGAISSVMVVVLGLFVYGRTNVSGLSGSGSVNFINFESSNQDKIVSEANDTKIIGVDNVLAARIAADIAADTGMFVKNNVINQADTLANQQITAPIKDDVLAKTQSTASVVSTTKPKAYTVVEGDNATSVATKFSIKSDTLKWANSLTSETLSVGTVITIPPIDGVLLDVKADTTAAELATKYKADAAVIIGYNDLASDGAVASGTQIMVVGGTKPIEAPAVDLNKVVAALATGSGVSQGSEAGVYSSNPIYGGNAYAYGYCTWHASNRRAAVGRPIPNNWGHAISWASTAKAQGFEVDGAPRAGDVIWFKGLGGYGHVEYVEAINADGSVLVSGMNNVGISGGGWNRISYYTIPVASFDKYLFIH